MANPLPLVGLPSDDAIWAATITSMSNEDSAFPRTRIKAGNPARVAKATTNSTSIVITTSSISPVAVGLFNTNAETATFGGVSVAIPALDADGQRRHPWLDRRTSPLSAGTSWTLALSRASGPVWIGHVSILFDIEELPLKYGLRTGRVRPGDLSIPTRLGSEIKHGADIRRRWATGAVDLLAAQPIVSELEMSAFGTIRPFAFIPDEAVNDAWLVTFRSDDYSEGIPDYDVRDVPLSFIEVSNGPPNG